VNQPIPIAFCITELDPGGAERAFVRLVTGLDRQHWIPEVYCLAGEGVLATPLREAGVPVTCLNLTGKRFPGGILQLRKQFRRQQPRLLQTFLFHANLLGRIAAVQTSIRHVVSGIRVAERRSPWYLRLDRWTDPLVTRHVCVSRAVADFSVAAGLPQEKLQIIPNGVDAALFQRIPPADLSPWGVPPEALTLCAVGRLDPQKGFVNLIDAFSRIARDRADAHLLIIGDGPLKSVLEQAVQNSPAGSRIHLLGRREDVPALLKASRLFVLPSIWEGMPNVVLEAAAAGIPIVATDVEGVSEILGERRSDIRFERGWRAEPADVHSLAKALEDAMSDEQQACRIASVAQAAIRSEFTWDAMVSRYSRLYEDLLKH